MSLQKFLQVADINFIPASSMTLFQQLTKIWMALSLALLFWSLSTLLLVYAHSFSEPRISNHEKNYSSLAMTNTVSSRLDEISIVPSRVTMSDIGPVDITADSGPVLVQEMASMSDCTTTPCFTENVTASTMLTNVQFNSIAWGDYDNDGDLDILLTGSTDMSFSTLTATVYRNDGPGGFVDINAGLIGVIFSNGVWGDYDNDGDLDILLAGCAQISNDDCSGSIARVYENDGLGNFTDINAGLMGIWRGSAAWGDYDNDGDLDILSAGCLGASCSTLSTKIYKNDGLGGFTDINAGLTGVLLSSAAWGDYDNDGDLDILLTGSADTAISTLIAKVYRNDGAAGFTDINADLTGVAFSSGVWGDYDNDGDLDILLVGCSQASSSCDHSIAKVYENNSLGSFADLNAGLVGVWRSSAIWGDYDNDGDLDALLTGCLGVSCTVRVATVYEGNGLGSFTNVNAALTGITEGGVAWGDYDNDNDLDIILTGCSDSNCSIPVTSLYENLSSIPNMSPSPPTGLVATVTDAQTEFAWNTAADTETLTSTGLTYNVYAGHSRDEVDLLSPMACIGTCGSGSDGYRQVPSLGNAQHGLTATLTITQPGHYYWSVQAVDTAFAGSSWAAEESFTVGPNLAIAKAVTPTTARPGEFITYTLRFSNTGNIVARNVVITDNLPAEITVQHVISRGDGLISHIVSTQLVEVFEVPELRLGQGGVITLAGQINPLLNADVTLKNQAVITSLYNINDSNNRSTADVAVTVPRLALAQSHYLTNESSGGIDGVVALNGAASAAVMVDYRTADDTAISGIDYTPVSGTLIIPTGQVTASFSVPITDDLIQNGTRRFDVILSSPQGAALTKPATATVTIADNDSASIVVNPMTVNVSEDGDTASYQVVLSTQPTTAVTVTVTGSTQVSANSSQLVFTSSNYDTPKDVIVSAVDDTLVEGTPHQSTISHDATSNDPSYNGISVASVTVKITDNENILTVDKSVYPAVVEPGDQITYTIVVTNNGGVSADITVRDELPDGVSGSSLDWSGSLTAHTALTYYFSAVVDESVGYRGLSITNTAIASYAHGSRQASAVLNIPADVTPPLFPITSPLLIRPTGTISNSRPVFEWKAATDSQSGVVSYTLIITGADDLSLSPIVTTQPFYTPTVDLEAPGRFTWTVRAHDAVGNDSAYVKPTAVFTLTSGLDTIYLPIVIK